MGAQEIAAAWRRAVSALQRRPQGGLREDPPATARWEHGTRVVASDGTGKQVETDMPRALGGSGDQVTPGWLLRAALASCAATRIAMAAAAEGVALTMLEVQAYSRSDTRGLLGMTEPGGELVRAAPTDVELRVRIAASGASVQQLRALVELSVRCSPVPCAVQEPIPLALQIEVDGD